MFASLRLLTTTTATTASRVLSATAATAPNRWRTGFAAAQCQRRYYAAAGDRTATTSAKRGLLSMEELTAATHAGDIETVVLCFSDMYGRLLGKRFDADFFLASGYKNGTHACDYLLATNMDMDPVPGYKLANWEHGYGDFHLVPDLQTLRLASWAPKTALVICDIDSVKTHEPLHIAPRSILRRQIGRAAETMRVGSEGGSGYTVKVASELEYYLYRDSYRHAMEKQYANLTSAGWYNEDYHILQGSRTEDFHSRVRRELKRSGIPVENSKGEAGVGQHELNVQYAEALTMADRHAVYKQCLKEVADQMGISVTFMAKPEERYSGSSCHIHISLHDPLTGTNAFVGSSDGLGPVRCSPVFKHFLGGLVHRTPELMPFFAPTVNSYKRFQSSSWAPTRLAVGLDNRTAGFRIVGPESPGLRIEIRIPGADVNPYLAFAAAIAAGLDGVQQRTPCPDIFTGDIYAAQALPRVPMTLRDAVTQMEKSSFAREAFGSEVIDHYVHFYNTEQQAYDKAVTSWELRRYFEQV